MADGGGAGTGTLHLLKLSVGTGSVADLAAWQESRAAERKRRGGRACPVHVTRMWPKRADQLLAGGSIYWVIRGMVSVRQRIVALEETRDGEGIRHCALVLDPALVRVAARPCRPFQGWRYLPAGDAPTDLATGPLAADALPPELEDTLAALGLRPSGTGR